MIWCGSKWKQTFFIIRKSLIIKTPLWKERGLFASASFRTFRHKQAILGV